MAGHLDSLKEYAETRADRLQMMVIKILWTDCIFKVIYFVIYVYVCANAQKMWFSGYNNPPWCQPNSIVQALELMTNIFEYLQSHPVWKAHRKRLPLTKSLWLACTCFCLEVWNGYWSGTCGCTPSAQVTLGDRRADGHGNKFRGILHHAMDLGVTAGVTSRSTGGRGLTDWREECRPRAFVWSRQLILLAVLEQIQWRGFLFLSFH